MWVSGDESVASGGQPAAGTGVRDPRIHCASQGQVQGDGATSQQSPMTFWITAYRQACPDVEVAYRPSSSAGGVAAFLDGTAAFGGTDEALRPEDVARSRAVCRGGRAVDVPVASAAIAVVYHLEGVDGLVLDAPTLAKIFDSAITRWNDPSIRALNPSVELPDEPIRTVHRSDSSGTTYHFTGYLSAAAPRSWPHAVTQLWQADGGTSATDSDGLATLVSRYQGAIGYVDSTFATAHRLKAAAIRSGSGRPVMPSVKAVSADIAGARVIGTGKDLALQLDYTSRSAGAYPIVMVTYDVVCESGNKPSVLPALKSFLSYTVGEAGQELLPMIGYAPLPEGIATRARKVVATLS
ncbi:phosphate ABC transporter substrate-binding protein PstS [Streptomyces sp. NPDC093272]|uniref:phosphate ABC transporter substrate-binding protein PstS n=1 Tax=unclassified Streptomyces TaxID=2593676 RepID=UPI00342C808C